MARRTQVRNPSLTPYAAVKCQRCAVLRRCKAGDTSQRLTMNDVGRVQSKVQSNKCQDPHRSLVFCLAEIVSSGTSRCSPGKSPAAEPLQGAKHQKCRDAVPGRDRRSSQRFESTTTDASPPCRPE